MKVTFFYDGHFCLSVLHRLCFLVPFHSYQTFISNKAQKIFKKVTSTIYLAKRLHLETLKCNFCQRCEEYWTRCVIESHRFQFDRRDLSKTRIFSIFSHKKLKLQDEIDFPTESSLSKTISSNPSFRLFYNLEGNNNRTTYFCTI